MAKGKKSDGNKTDSGLNFGTQLWAAADKMHVNIDDSEYTHLGLTAFCV